MLSQTKTNVFSVGRIREDDIRLSVGRIREDDIRLSTRNQTMAD